MKIILNEGLKEVSMDLKMGHFDDLKIRQFENEVI
jgi:hypothetical protein